MSKQHVSLYDNQHYIDSQWGGSPEGEPIDCTYLRELTVTVKWKTAGGKGAVRVLVRGSGLDQDAHQLAIVLQPPAATSYGTTVEYSAVQQHGLNGQLVATWRDLPKWCGVRVECVEGTQGEGSALRVAVLGR
jgi:hypothetical protein